MTDSDKLVIPAQRLAAVLTDANLFAAKANKCRPVLRSVKLTASEGRGQAVSTDSYGLGVFTFDCEGTMSALIDTDDVKRIIAVCTEATKGRAQNLAEALEIVIERDDETLTVRSYATTITCRLVPGEFPNWRMLVAVPEVHSGQGSFNSAFIARMASIRLGESAKQAPALTIAATTELKPWHFYAAANGIEFRGLLMTVRDQHLPEGAFGAPEVVGN
jgi:DNA polymerase III sliding clamp (beta) subunit (PCNA family)